MRKKHQAATVQATRATKRSRAGAVEEAVAAAENPFASTKKDGTSSMWKEETLDKLIDLLQKEGFDGDYGELNRNHLPQFGECTIRHFFNKLSRWKEPTTTTEGGGPSTTSAAKQQNTIIEKIKYIYSFIYIPSIHQFVKDITDSILLLCHFIQPSGNRRGRGTIS